MFFQLAKQVHDSEWIAYFADEFYNRAFDPRYLLELSERNPEAALAWVQMMKEFGGERVLNRRSQEFFERASHPRYLLELSERNPEAALAWVKMMKEFGGERVLHRLGPEFFERASHPRYLLELSERNPEAALAWVQMMKEFGGERVLHRLGPEFFERAFDPGRSVKGTTFAVLLQLARIQESSQAIDLVLRYLISSIRYPIRHGFSLEMLPMAAIRDIQWLAKTTSNPEINSVLNSLLDETTS